jgi:adenine-specific DNA-methyltransferase
MTELNFKGKEFVFNHHLAVPFRPVKPDAAKGIGPAILDGNLIIQGDNLHALKALLPMYSGRVDCVYIDPPYNTGNENWRYNDNVSSPLLRQWLQENPVGIDDGLRHEKWACMMWPRLRLLHELLADTGIFACSIDDNELSNLCLLLDEVFGERNRLVVAPVITNLKGNQDQFGFAGTHEYIVFYAKDRKCAQIYKFPIDDAKQDEWLKDERGPFKPGAPLRATGEDQYRENRPEMFYPIILKDGRAFLPDDDEVSQLFIKKEKRFDDEQKARLTKKYEELGFFVLWPETEEGRLGRWRWGFSKKTRERLSYDVLIGPSRRSGFSLRKKQRPEEDEEPSAKPKTLFYKPEYSSTTAANELKELLNRDAFSHTKSLGFISDVLQIACPKNGLILDAFAGSGTTAHAVLSLNKKDSGGRKFILIEAEDYADTLTAERVRRAISGYPFVGLRRTELSRTKLNWRTLQKASEVLQRIEEIENTDENHYDKIKKEVKNAELIVIGEKTVTERAEGLGGNFTYCTLGAPLELDSLLLGETLPPYAAIGAVLFSMATNRAFDPAGMREADFYLGQTEGQHIWLFYKPDLDWLKSPEAALTLTRAKAISETAPEKRHLVFAPARFVSQKMLTEQKIQVEFVPLPDALYRIDRS